MRRVIFFNRKVPGGAVAPWSNSAICLALSQEIELCQPQTGELEFVDDLDLLVELSKCSCNAGDDNLY